MAPATPREAPLLRAPFSSEVDDAEAALEVAEVVEEREDEEVDVRELVVPEAALELVVAAELVVLAELPLEVELPVDEAVAEPAVVAEALPEVEPLMQLSSLLLWMVTAADWTVLPVESFKVNPMEVPCAISVVQEYELPSIESNCLRGVPEGLLPGRMLK